MIKPDVDERVLKNAEGLRLRKYKCSGGHWTIGYGHKLGPGEDYPTGITKEKAEELFWQDVIEADQLVRKYIHVPLNRNQRTALISLVFNCGQAPLLGTPGKLLNAGKYLDAAKSLCLYRHDHGKGHPCSSGCGGLLMRRKKERDLFLLAEKPTDV